MQIVGLAGLEDGHFLGQPAGTAFAFQLFLQLQIDVAQMGHVRQRIVELLVGKRPPAPVGEARGLVDVDVLHLLHQLVIGHAVAEATHHGCDLGVEDRVRNEVAEMEDDFDVLARRMEHLGHGGIGHQREEGRQIEAFSQWIDNDFKVRARHLDQAQLRPERRFPQELGVDGDEIRLGQLPAGFF